MFREIDTPALIVDEAILNNNLARMAEQANSRRLAFRPHTKTHKSPVIARRQVDLGAQGIMVAKLGEAEVMLDAGLAEQSIGYPLIGQIKEDRLVTLLHRGARVRVSVDSLEGLALLSQAYERTGIEIEALIEVDTGMSRCGLSSQADIVALAQQLVRTNGVSYRGITCFGGHMAKTHVKDEIVQRIREEDRYLRQVVNALRRERLAPEIVSEGGTIPAAFLDELTVATEIRPGTYVYNDAATVASHAAAWDDCALWVLTTVVSKPAANRIIVDAGSKTLSSDGPVDGGYGAVLGHPQYRIRRLSEEHGVMEADEALPYTIGDRLFVIPNHACTTVNLHDMAFLLNDGAITGTLPIVGRGRVR